MFNIKFLNDPVSQIFELVFAQRFMDRVEETFINDNKRHKFAEFLCILRNFSENQQRKSGADLYLVNMYLFSFCACVRRLFSYDKTDERLFAVRPKDSPQWPLQMFFILIL